MKSAIRIALVFNLIFALAALSLGQSISSLTVSPTAVVGGASSTGTVTLSAAAPAGGVTVALTDNVRDLILPSSGSVTVAAGSKTATFTIGTQARVVDEVATITGTTSTSSASARLSVLAPKLVSISVSPGTVGGGTPVTGTVVLTGVAPSGGMSVSLSSSNISVATTPAAVVVAAGSSSGTFTITTLAATKSSSVTITASLNSITKTATLSVGPIQVSAVSTSADNVIGGNGLTCKVTINGSAPAAGLTVKLSTNVGAATVPSTLSIPAGAVTASTTITTVPVAADHVVTVSASYNGVVTSTFNLLAPKVSALSLNPNTLFGGATSTGTVTLTGNAPTGGLSVTLTSSSTDAQVPSTVRVAGAANSGTFKITTSAVSTRTVAKIKAAVGTSSISLNLSINASDVQSVTFSSPIVFGGLTTVGTVTLNGPAPAGGYAIVLTSANTSTVNVPRSVSIAAGKTAATFTAATAAVAQLTDVKISAKDPNAVTVSARLQVDPGSLPSNSIFYVIDNISSTDLHFVSPDGTGDEKYGSVDTLTDGIASNPAVAHQFVFARQPSSSANFGLYSNSSLSVTGATTLIDPTKSTFDDISAVQVTPDGKTIYFIGWVNGANEGELCSIPMAGGTPAVIDNAESFNLNVGGTKIVYSKLNGSTGDIFVVFLSNLKKPQDMTPKGLIGNDNVYPEWSKGNNSIIFSSDGGNGVTLDLFEMPAAGGAATQLTNTPGTDNIGASLNTDGTQVSYIAINDSNPSQTSLNVGPVSNLGSAKAIVTNPNVYGTYWTSTGGRGGGAPDSLMLGRFHRHRR